MSNFKNNNDDMRNIQNSDSINNSNVKLSSESGKFFNFIEVD
jgi:hypothetical protein